MMHIDQRKEQFSKAYVHAVAAVAGYATYELSVDDDSIDFAIAARGSEHTTRRPRLEMQLKCTHSDVRGADHLSYPLKIKNYDDLRADVIVPRILVVVMVPEDVNLWLQHSEEKLCLKHCAYWVSLLGEPPTSNTDTVTVHLPRANQFNASALQSMMESINRGDTL
jgi:hypothetical protein